MKYEYQGIKLGDSIEKIINLLNNENTKLNDFGTDLTIKINFNYKFLQTLLFLNFECFLYLLLLNQK